MEEANGSLSIKIVNLFEALIRPRLFVHLLFEFSQYFCQPTYRHNNITPTTASIVVTVQRGLELTIYWEAMH